MTPGKQTAIVVSLQDSARAQSKGGDRKSNQTATLPHDRIADRTAKCEPAHARPTDSRQSSHGVPAQSRKRAQCWTRPAGVHRRSAAFTFRRDARVEPRQEWLDYPILSENESLNELCIAMRPHLIWLGRFATVCVLTALLVLNALVLLNETVHAAAYRLLASVPGMPTQASLMTRTDDARRDHEALRDEVARQSHRGAALSQQNAILTEGAARATSQISALQREQAHTLVKLEALSGERDQLASSLRAIQSENATLSAIKEKLERDREALRQMNDKLQASNQGLLQKLAARQAATLAFSRRTMTRLRAAAIRNSSSVLAEAVPIAGIAIMLAVTAADLYDFCQTATELTELNRVLEGAQAPLDKQEACGHQVPSVDEVKRRILTPSSGHIVPLMPANFATCTTETLAMQALMNVDTEVRRGDQHAAGFPIGADGSHGVCAPTWPSGGGVPHVVIKVIWSSPTKPRSARPAK